MRFPPPLDRFCTQRRDSQRRMPAWNLILISKQMWRPYSKQHAQPSNHLMENAMSWSGLFSERGINQPEKVVRIRCTVSVAWRSTNDGVAIVMSIRRMQNFWEITPIFWGSDFISKHTLSNWISHGTFAVTRFHNWIAWNATLLEI